MLWQVLYSDGEREDLNMRTLDILLRNDNRRVQVLLVQVLITQISTYIKQHDERVAFVVFTTLTRSQREEDALFYTYVLL